FIFFIYISLLCIGGVKMTSLACFCSAPSSSDEGARLCRMRYFIDNRTWKESVRTSITSLTSSVFVPSGDHRILISRVEAPNALGYEFPIGQLLSLTLGGGKVLLAHKSPEDQERIIEESASTTLADFKTQTPETLRTDIKQILKTGIFVSSSERSQGTVSLTAPIRNAHDKGIASINSTGHDRHTNAEAILEFQSTALQAARRVSTQMF
ncbi:IclR family transcriptional regulator domain-containing protein, partial [Corynebacterium casei]|uniref:IclR family transcriptional regulator domain-containing protein n=1 Tax=Corynebacterium casei TaxID=160386 RepID=UPI0026474F29